MGTRSYQLRWSHIVVTMIVGVWGCSSETSPNEPEGGYLVFRDALLTGNIPTLWESVSQTTRTLYDDAYNDLLVTAESIERLPPEDRVLARERTGISLLERADSGEELFAVLIRLELLIGDNAFSAGTEIDEITLDSSGDRATVVTDAEQAVELVLEEDGIWRVTTLEPFARNALRPFSDNLIAVEALASESAYLRRSHDEIFRLLGGVPESELNEGTGAAAEEGGEEEEED